jgi:hypothetical protein
MDGSSRCLAAQDDIDEQELTRRFYERLSDWSEPGEIKVIPNGRLLEPRIEPGQAADDHDSQPMPSLSASSEWGSSVPILGSWMTVSATPTSARSRSPISQAGAIPDLRGRRVAQLCRGGR